jgi:hypothetical protein
MPISEFHASHIQQVWVTFCFSAPGLDPSAVTAVVGIDPTDVERQGDVRRNFAGNVLGTYDRGSWYLSSKGAVESKDINDHFKYLLERLLPGRDVFVLATAGETYFDVLWKSTYLYAGTGPLGRCCVDRRDGSPRSWRRFRHLSGRRCRLTATAADERNRCCATDCGRLE